MSPHSIPEKANKILQLILIVLLLILARVWFLTIVKHEEGIDAASKPPRKVTTLKPERATIRDRFNVPLALNKIQYNASVSYSQIRTIPAVTFVKDASGKKQKIFKRKAYIKEFSQVIGQVLSMDPDRIEDLIHAKAALLGFAPLVIKEDLSESEYFKLRMLEKDYPGIIAEKAPKRYYPQGCTACDVVGFMGSISKEEYEKIINEIHALKEYLKNHEDGYDDDSLTTLANPSFARRRLKELQEKAYTITDLVGKSGVEGHFDETLRGYLGKQVFFSDIKGHLLRELPESKPQIPGERLLLTLSSELQEYAEALLAENEAIREGKSLRLDKKNYTYKAIKQPWIKGGAIIALDPNTGEILALASYPRFDPNDFIPAKETKLQKEKHAKVVRWLENDRHVAEIWDQKTCLKRERYSFSINKFTEEEKILSWENYLSFVLEDDHPVIVQIKNYNQIRHAIKAQNGSLENVFNELSPYNQKLLLDLYKISVAKDRFSKELLDVVGKQTLSHYRQVNAAYANIYDFVLQETKKTFHDTAFTAWRQENQTEFLQEKRKNEKLKKISPKPYIDYLDKEEKRLFDIFWDTNKYDILACYLDPSYNASPEINTYIEALKIATLDEQSENLTNHLSLLKEEFCKLKTPLNLEYLKTLRCYEDLNEPLNGKYPGLRSFKGLQLEKHLAAAFFPKHGFGYGRSFAFRQAVQVGSVFKIATAYSALLQPYRQNNYSDDYKLTAKDLSPLTIIDDLHRAKQENAKLSQWNVGYTIDGKPITQHYKGGRIPRSQHSNIGRVTLAEAIETSSNPYFALLAGDVIEKPSDLLETARMLSYGDKTGINIPGEIKGRLPDDVNQNKTGLYAFAIGQHSIVSTPLQTAVMLSSIANKGKVLEPNVVYLQAGKQLVHKQEELFSKRNYPYKEALSQVGIHFPLFTQSINAQDQSSVSYNASRIRRLLFLPDSIREYLLDSMRKVIHGARGTARSSHIRTFSHRPQMLKDFEEMGNYMVGKTSTAEMQERTDLSQEGVHMVNHIGFASIAFEDSKNKVNPYDNPELVVVVFLRYGDYGKEAAPIAASIVKKWREIKAKNNN
jgi:cell division protein FtsI/penicillin-binding protein 2